MIKKMAIALLCVLLIVWWGSSVLVQPHEDEWYGYCKIGNATQPLLFVARGDAIYIDRNADGIVQREERLPESGEFQLPLGDDGTMGHFSEVSTAFLSSAVTDDVPQVLLFEFQSTGYPELSLAGWIVTSRKKREAGTCHLLGPLSFWLVPTDFVLKAGESNTVKIAVGTLQTDSALVSPTTQGPSGAYVNTSLAGNRAEYAFDSKLRPNLSLAFNGEPPETIVFDGFC